jgi:hypothetical protein
MKLYRASTPVLLLGLTGMIGLSACVADAPQANGTNPQFSRESYDCGKDGCLVVDRHPSSVIVSPPEADKIALPAAPPGQGTRFGEGVYALLVSDGEALWMVGNERPLTCRRPLPASID